MRGRYAPGGDRAKLGDFTTDSRVLVLALMAVAVGTFGAAAAGALVRLIWLVTNVVWFGKLSMSNVSLAGAAPGLLMVLIPVLGGLTIGLMARSDRRRSAVTASPKPWRQS
jgi:chloride channel protein, CIC family